MKKAGDPDAARGESADVGFCAFFEMTEGMISFEESTLLYDLARETVPPYCIVEVGSFRGRSTVALGRGSLDGHRVAVFAIEPHEEFTGVLGGSFGPSDRAAFYKVMLDTSCYSVVRLINLSSEMVVSRWKHNVGLLWIDGDHSYEGVRRDFECWQPHLAPGARIAFDDSRNPRLGPSRLIYELLKDRHYVLITRVGKISVLRAR